MRFQLTILFLVLLGPSSCIYANQIDSLLSLLDNTSNPNIRADYLLQVDKGSYEQSHDIYLSYSEKALEETKHPTFNNDTLKMKIVNNVGCAYSEINDAQQANKYFFDATKLALKIDDQRYLSNLYNNIGLTYGNVHEYDKALEFHLKSLKIKEQRNDSLGISISNTNIGAIYYALKDYQKAKESFEKSFNISKIINDTEGVAFGYTNLADVFFAENQYLESLDYYNKYLELVTELKYNHSILYGHKKLGEIYIKLDNLIEAGIHLEKAYRMAITSNYTWELTNICLLYATLKKQTGDYNAALSYTKKALDYFPNSASKKKLADVHKTISEVYELQGKNTMALTHLKTHLLLKDSASQKENMETFAEMESKYQVELKETENQFLKEKQTLDEQIISQRTMIAMVSMAGTFLLFLLAFWLYRLKETKHQLNLELEDKVRQRTQHLEILNQQLGQANEELERFFYITSHDLKEPLRNIMSFSNLVKRRLREHKYDDADKYLVYVEQGTSQMDTLLKGIMSFFGTKKNDVLEMQPLNVILDTAEKELDPKLKDSNPQFFFQSKADIDGIIFPQSLTIIFKHIIENGIKFNEHESPVFKIDVWNDPTYFYFSIEDNGIGIAEAYHEQIFEMFKRLHPRVKFKGSGIGLSICKKITQQLKGDIKVKSSGDEGTTILFWINKTECQHSSDLSTTHTAEGNQVASSPLDEIASIKS